jgi:hypothetical protein
MSALPQRVPFEVKWGDADRLFSKPRVLPYRIIGKRPPRKGEYYLSGAIPAAYIAPNDLTTAYLIVEPVEPKPCPTCGHID